MQLNWQKSLKFEDIPVGCVITNSNNKIIGKGYNSCIKNNDPSAHAELLAIRMACREREFDFGYSFIVCNFRTLHDV